MSLKVYELCLVKVLLTFIGCFDSNHGAFYLYVATSVGLNSTPHKAHA